MDVKGKKTRLVVVGNGIAGAAFVEEMLKFDPGRFDITVFGDEGQSYNRVLLAQVLTGEKALSEISLHSPQWYKERGIRLYSGMRVKEIKRKSRAVIAEGGVEQGYDKLIIATGSVPILPRLDGIDKKGVFTFRNISDCERIRAASKKGAKAVVIGGGLLGLEAAWALKGLGMEVTVAHLMDRLMERQLDGTAAGFLKEDLERLGINVMLNKEAVGIFGDGDAKGVEFKDGARIEAEVIIFSIGIRPNIDLARSSGLYCEKGVVVSDCMQTFDPAIFAAGECVEHRGKTFGSIGPAFEQARVLANHVAGDGRLVFKQQPASARLKVPGIELYSAGEIDEGHGESIEYIDRRERSYKRLVVKDDRIVGIIMYGDTEGGPELFASVLEKEDISNKRRGLLLRQRPSGESAVEDIPDEAIVCGCNGVTKGMIVEAIEEKGLFTREDVKRETKASGSCGGCAPLVDRILEATLGSDFNVKREEGICPCTRYSREDIIKNIKEKGLKSVREVMDTLGWESVGCEKCRPALNYYVGMVWPSQCEDDQTSRLVNERMHANIQQDGTFSVVPRMYGGVTSAEGLKRIAEAAVKYAVPLIKLTGGQRIALIGVKREDLAEVWKDLGMPSGYAYGKALRTVKTCVGSAYCRYGTQDSLNLGIELEKKFEGLWMPAKVKIGVSGCPRNCAEPQVKDIGVIGVSGGWEIRVGGSGGIELKEGEAFCSVKGKEELFGITGALIQFYRESAHYGERTFKWVRRVGLKNIKKEVVDDIGNRARLISAVEEALAVTRDPWKDRASGEEGKRQYLH